MNETQRKIDYNNKQISFLRKRINAPSLSDLINLDALSGLIKSLEKENEKLEKELVKDS